MNYKTIGYQITETRHIRHIREIDGTITHSEPVGDTQLIYKLILQDVHGNTIHAEVPEYYFMLIRKDIEIAPPNS